MAVAVLIPKLGMTMTEGTVAQWCVPDGGTVEPGQVVYRLETEKIQFDVEAEAAGVVRHLVPEGTKLPPGAVVAYILAPGEPMPEGVAPTPAAVGATPAAAVASATAKARPAVVLEGGRIPASPIARRLAREAGLDLRAIAGSGPGGRIVEADVLAVRARAATAAAAPAARPAPTPAPAAAGPAPAGVSASPLARRLAEQLGIDLAQVRGTGPGGRITREDVEQAAAARALTPAFGRGAGGEGRVPAGRGEGSPGPGVGVEHRPGEVIPMRGMRKVIAERMHASLQEMAQLTLGMTVLMDEAVKLRTQLADEWAAEGVRPSFTDLVIKAVAKALQRHPLLNARVTEAGIELLTEIHIGMAVAVPDGLLVPVIRDADRRSLKEIAAESTRLAEAARAGRVTLDELAGSTFTVTPLGMYDVDFFTPIINPPNVAILGVGRIHDATGWENDRPVRRRQMTLSLTIDHRAVDGAPAAAFLQTVRDLLQAPYRLLV
jgi:pyruvate/2-oxoglutarate dehydrogenase complex dihydrolipoamide acyltransferase (E2) component